MRPITLAGIEEYVERHTSPETPVLQAVARETQMVLKDPQMMSGPVQGRLLEMLVYALRPRLVVEIGTFSGYSALCMAAALPPEGRLVTCEVDEVHAELARRHIAGSAYAGRIVLEVGPALSTLARLDGPFDLVFIDAEKALYLDYLEAVLPKLSPRGLIAADNTLWNGDVVYQRGAADDDVAALRRFNESVVSDPRLICVLLTVRDGMTLIRPRGGEE